MKFRTFSSSVLSIAITLSVLLSGVHAKDVVKPREAAAAKSQGYKKFSSDDGARKASTEHLHNHVDKQSLKTFKFSNSTVYHAERRSLTLLERDLQTVGDRLKIGFSLWLRLAFAKMML